MNIQVAKISPVIPKDIVAPKVMTPEEVKKEVDVMHNQFIERVLKRTLKW